MDLELNGRLEKVRAENLKYKNQCNSRRHGSGESASFPAGDGNWTYGSTADDADLHVEAATPLDSIVMGINPGDGNGTKVPRITPSEKAWRTRCANLTNSNAHQIVFAELIYDSTHDLNALKAHPAGIRALMLESRDLNLAIIDFHRPKVVFQPGITPLFLDLAVELYGLTAIQTVNRTGESGILLKSYRMADGTPWIAFRHFAGFGFRDKDREDIQEYYLQMIA